MFGTSRVVSGTLLVSSLDGNGEIGIRARQGLSCDIVATGIERGSGTYQIGCFPFIERIC